MKNFGMNIADLYAGLMMIFLFVSISMLVEAKQKQTEVEKQKSEIIKITEGQNNLRQKIYEDLNLEFKDNLDEWNAVIETDLTIRFPKSRLTIRQWLFRLEAKIQRDIDQLFSSLYENYIKLHDRDTQCIYRWSHFIRGLDRLRW